MLLNNFVGCDAIAQSYCLEKSTAGEQGMKKWPPVKLRVQFSLLYQDQSKDQNIYQLFALYQVKQFIFQIS